MDSNVYSGLEYFDVAWALFKRKIETMFESGFVDSESYVTRFVTRLEKCPNHFAVITGNERINLEDFSNLIIWCKAAGISYISFYDYTGYLKDNRRLYFDYLISKKELNPNYIAFNEKIVSAKNGFGKNGFKKKIHVNILSVEDGKPLFAKLVENLCEKALADDVKIEDIDERFIDVEIYKMVWFSEPELAVVCGNVCGTFGFLPWHIRLTEFLQIPSLENIRVSDFTSLLKKYSSCHQRFGC